MSNGAILRHQLEESIDHRGQVLSRDDRISTGLNTFAFSKAIPREAIERRRT
jgi:hypothetical protein